MKQIRGAEIIVGGFIGVILGTIAANVLEHTAPHALAALAIDQYTVSAQLLENRKAWGLYLLRQRGLQMLGAMGVGLLCHTIGLLVLFAFFGGLLWGLLLSLETMRLGIRGLFLAIACFLPQGAFYAGAFLCFFLGKEAIREQAEVRAVRILRVCLPTVAAMAAGLLLEIWASPELIGWILQ